MTTATTPVSLGKGRRISLACAGRIWIRPHPRPLSPSAAAGWHHSTSESRRLSRGRHRSLPTQARRGRQGRNHLHICRGKGAKFARPQRPGENFSRKTFEPFVQFETARRRRRKRPKVTHLSHLRTKARVFLPRRNGDIAPFLRCHIYCPPSP